MPLNSTTGKGNLRQHAKTGFGYTRTGSMFRNY
jgi:hypothetical protein